MDESSRAELIDESMIDLLALNLECTSEWRREKAEQYPNDNRNLPAAEKLSELASQVRQLKGSPLHLEFNNFHRQLLAASIHRGATWPAQVAFVPACEGRLAWL